MHVHTFYRLKKVQKIQVYIESLQIAFSLGSHWLVYDIEHDHSAQGGNSQF